LLILFPCTPLHREKKSGSEDLFASDVGQTRRALARFAYSQFSLLFKRQSLKIITSVFMKYTWEITFFSISKDCGLVTNTMIGSFWVGHLSIELMKGDPFDVEGDLQNVH
jgi:hypothetical protein